MHPATHAQLVKLGIACSVQYSGTVRAGALLAYEPAGVEEIAVDLAARILRGERVATMPARQADRIRLSINLRTARALGIKVPRESWCRRTMCSIEDHVPRSILLRADRVVE